MATDVCGIVAVRGTWIYSTPILRIYDWLVPGLLNRFVWKCNSRLLTDQYAELTSPRHIDLGPGTGYFLCQAARRKELRFESLMLVDESQASLNYATRVLGEFGPRQIRLDLTRQESVQGLSGESANSVSANYLIHCLPRGLRDTDAMFQIVSQVIGTEGVFFGSTILPELARRRIRSRFCCWLFNRLGIFGNKHDSFEALEHQLTRYFRNCETRVVQCVAMFSANNRVTRDHNG